MVADINAVHAGKLGLDFFFFLFFFLSFSLSEGLDFSVGMLIGLVTVGLLYGTKVGITATVSLFGT